MWRSAPTWKQDTVQAQNYSKSKDDEIFQSTLRHS